MGMTMNNKTHPAERLNAAPSQADEDGNAYDERRCVRNAPRAWDVWHAALEWERSRKTESREQIEARLKEAELVKALELIESWVQCEINNAYPAKIPDVLQHIGNTAARALKTTPKK